MRAYGELMFGLKKGDEESMNKYIRDALVKYCKLDTLSMVIIWEYWDGINNVTAAIIIKDNELLIAQIKSNDKEVT